MRGFSPQEYKKKNGGFIHARYLSWGYEKAFVYIPKQQKSSMQCASSFRNIKCIQTAGASKLLFYMIYSDTL